MCSSPVVWNHWTSISTVVWPLRVLHSVRHISHMMSEVPREVPTCEVKPATLWLWTPPPELQLLETNSLSVFRLLPTFLNWWVCEVSSYSYKNRDTWTWSIIFVMKSKTQPVMLKSSSNLYWSFSASRCGRVYRMQLVELWNRTSDLLITGRPALLLKLNRLSVFRLFQHF